MSEHQILAAVGLADKRGQITTISGLDFKGISFIAFLAVGDFLG